ncbi:MFS transporter [Neobacillus niacini]|uniref:MFS transporter n=1 Tax=Neobacillus niacini TaxID=86668 RepID=UPI00203B0E2E|nr:MFS transporter [Neobacillus niacini]MCM3693572.1 MFS transporter [Neobacillus niacini]
MNLLQKKDPYQVYIYTCFISQLLFTLIFTVNLLYQVKTVQLDPLQLVLVGTVLEATVFIFEIPTGILSDLKSRKLSVIIGFFLIGIGFVIEGMFPFFTAVILSQVIWGIGYTFTSGSHQAWIADEIGEKRASSAFVKGAKAGNLGKVLAIPLSILAGYYTLNLPIIMGGIGLVVLSMLLIFFMKEENFKPAGKVERVSVWKNIKENMGQILYYSRVNYLMRILFLIALFFGFYSEGFDRLWIPHFIEQSGLSNLSDSQLVLLMGGVEFIVVLLTFAALHFIENSSIHQNLNQIYVALFIGSMLIIGSLIGFGFTTFAVGLVAFYIIIQISRSIMYPLESVWLNKIIPDSSTRATFFSVKGQVDAIGQIGGGPVIGVIASNFTIKIAIMVSAVLLMPVLFLYSHIMRKTRG